MIKTPAINMASQMAAKDIALFFGETLSIKWRNIHSQRLVICLLYTSDAADE